MIDKMVLQRSQYMHSQQCDNRPVKAYVEAQQAVMQAGRGQLEAAVVNTVTLGNKLQLCGRGEKDTD